jgi:hypothetical protein
MRKQSPICSPSLFHEKAASKPRSCIDSIICCANGLNSAFRNQQPKASIRKPGLHGNHLCLIGCGILKVLDLLNRFRTPALIFYYHQASCAWSLSPQSLVPAALASHHQLPLDVARSAVLAGHV